MSFELSNKFKEHWAGSPSFDELMALDGEVYRQVARRKTFKFSLQGHEYFAKLHKGVGWAEIIKNWLLLRKPVLGAVNEYEAIKALSKLGINTMTLAAYGQRGTNPAELDSFVITESLEPALSLEDLSLNWAKQPPEPRLKRALIKCVASMSGQLHRNGINHRDLYICHFLLKQDELAALSDINELQLYLIDLHRVQMRAQLPRRWQVKDLAALYFSSMDIGLSQRDCLRFIRAYSGRDLATELTENKRLWLDVERKARLLKSKPVKD
ncbi:MAG: lipopolysaccharide core heptose(I) kinase RfaP [Cycloclasticus sp.]